MSRATSVATGRIYALQCMRRILKTLWTSDKQGGNNAKKCLENWTMAHARKLQVPIHQYCHL